MTVLLRVAGGAVAALILWSAAASRVVEQVRLPAGAVVRGAVVTQPFGCTAVELEPFDLACPSHHVHTGVDLAAHAGTPVYAATGGRASVGYDSGGCGLYIVVAYDDHVRVLYCHLQQAQVVSGASIEMGQLIGEVGSTGLSTGPHLHLEVQVNRRPVDPVQWLASP